MNIEDWFPLGLIGWCPWSARDSQESSPAPQFKSSAFFMVQLSHPYMTTGKTIVPRSKHLLISWLQSLSTVILETKKIKSVTVSIVSLFPMKWWDWMSWSYFSKCWVLSQLFTHLFTFIKRLFSSSLLSAIRVGSSAYLRLLIFSQQSWFQLVFHPAQNFTWCTLHIS